MAHRPLVLVLVIDGLRPASITTETMPYLARLRREGSQYLGAFATFPALTRTNAATLVTGRLPDHTGVFGNMLRHPELGAVDTGSAQQVRQLRATIPMPPLGIVELLEQDNRTCVVVGNGSAGCTYVLNPATDRGVGVTLPSSPSAGSVVRSLPDDVARVFEHLGDVPSTSEGSLAWAAEAARLSVSALAPDVLIFWSGEPDTVQHQTGLHSGKTLATLTRVDDVIRELHTAALASGRQCNLFVTADHGFCSASQAVQVDAEFADVAEQAGVAAEDVAVAPNGGAVFGYLHPSVPERARRAFAEVIAERSWAGPTFCRDDFCPQALFPLSWVGMRSASSPDLLITTRTDSTDPTAVREHSAVAWCARASSSSPHRAVHGTVDPADLRIPLILHGPAFRTGARLRAPAGIADIAPTVYELVTGRDLPGRDGRVLTEAFANGRDSTTDDEVVTTIRQRGRCRLAFREYGGIRYLVGGVRLRGHHAQPSDEANIAGRTVARPS